jgi:hypothetical protein
MQRAVNETIEEEVFSKRLAYIHCWTTVVFTMGPPRDYISSPVVEREHERSKFTAAKECVRLKIDCELL